MVDARPGPSRTALPPDQEAIEEALVGLDVKLAAWCGAIADVQHKLRDLTVAVSQPTESDALTQTGTDALDQVSAHRTEETAALSQVPRDDAEPVVVRETEATEDAREAAGPESASEEQQHAAPTDEADILAGLDEKTAYKVTVMRRLAPNKSLAELIELNQSQAKRGSKVTTEPVKRSWWRKG